jgi:alpha-1,4-digalacturonate transport system substrate-binding protein
LLSEYGTTLFDEDSVTLDEDAAASVVGLLVDLMESGAMSRDFWLESGSRYEGANEIFLAEESPVYIAGNWMVAEFAKSAEFEWAAVPNPCAERCGGFPGGKYMAAFERSDNPELAAAFVGWMNRAEQQEQMAAEALFLPTRKDLLSQGVDYRQRGEDMQVFRDEVGRTPEDTYAAVANPAFGAAADVLAEEISEVLAGNKDVETAVADTEAEAEELLEDSQ